MCGKLGASVRSPGSTESKRARGRPRAHRRCHPAAARDRLAKQGCARNALQEGAPVRPGDRAAARRQPCRGARGSGPIRHPTEREWAQADRPTALRLRLPQPQLVRNNAEQTAIRMMRQYRAVGLSLLEIAANLNLVNAYSAYKKSRSSEMKIHCLTPRIRSPLPCHNQAVDLSAFPE